MSDVPSGSYPADSPDQSALSSEAPNVGDHERGRQAIHSLGGYAYQIFQTVLAWQNLKSDDLLFIEVSEDYAVVARDAIESAQVKDVAGSLSLGQQESAKPLNALWDLRANNPGKQCRLTFLTTQNTCQEKSLTFPGGAHGIDYWNTCRNSDADVAPLREAIQKLQLSAELSTFVATASDTKLRENLINRIEWICNRPELSEIENLLQYALISFGATRSMTADDALKALPALALQVLHSAIKPQVVDRMLRSSDFITTFEVASMVSVPASTLRQYHALLNSQLGQASVLEASITKVFIAREYDLFPRRALVLATEQRLNESGFLWLHGPIGCGKSSLAEALMRALGAKGVHIAHRFGMGALGERITYLFASLRARLSAGTVVLLDEVHAAEIAEAIEALSALAYLCKSLGVKLIIVSNGEVPHPLKLYFSTSMVVSRLTFEEIKDAIRSNGGDPAVWGNIVYVTSSNGNPALAAAHIAGLTERSWPADKARDEFIQAEETDDIPRTRTRFRSVIREIYDADAVRLIARLSVVGGCFSRALANAVSDFSAAGQFDRLIGPIFERQTQSLFRLTALASSAPVEWGLSEDEVITTRRAVLTHIARLQSIPFEYVCVQLAHGLALADAWALTSLANYVVTCPKEDMPAIAFEMRELARHSQCDMQLFLPGKPSLSALIRLAQHKIASTIGSARLAIISSRLVIEIEQVEIAGVHPIAVIGLSHLLFDAKQYIHPREWLAMVMNLGKKYASMLASPHFSRLAPPDIPSGDKVAFVTRVGMLRGATDLLRLVEAMQAVDATVRDSYLDSLAMAGVHGKRLMFQYGWFRDAKTEPYPAEEILQNYRKIIPIVDSWGDEEAITECHNAIVVIHSEYQNAPTDAIAYIAALPKKVSEHIILRRQLGKICFREKEYAKAISVYRDVYPRLPREDWIDRWWSLREWCISLASTEKVREAIRILSQELNDIALNPLAAPQLICGSYIDLAYMQFKVERFSDSIVSLRHAVDLFGQFGSPKSHEEMYRIRIWINVAFSILDPEVFPDVIPFGLASNTDPSPEVAKLPFLNEVTHWYLLASLEGRYQVHGNAFDVLTSKTRDRMLPTMEKRIFEMRLLAAARTQDWNKWRSSLSPYCVASIFIGVNGRSERMEPTTLYDRPTCRQVADANLALLRNLAADALLTLCVVRLNMGAPIKTPDVDFLLSSTGSPEADTLRQMAQAMKERGSARGNDFYKNTLRMAAPFVSGASLSAIELAQVTHCLCQWFRAAYMSKSIPNVFDKVLINSWRSCLDQQEAQFREPREFKMELERLAASGPVGGRVFSIALLVATHLGITVPEEIARDYQARAKMENGEKASEE